MSGVNVMTEIPAQELRERYCIGETSGGWTAILPSPCTGGRRRVVARCPLGHDAVMSLQSFIANPPDCRSCLAEIE